LGGTAYGDIWILRYQKINGIKSPVYSMATSFASPIALKRMIKTFDGVTVEAHMGAGDKKYV
jgi:hypothetical protein